MLFGVMSGVGRGMSVLDGWGCDRGRQRAVLGMNLGRPIVTNGTLLHSCVKVPERIEMQIGVVSEVSGGMDVLDGSTCLKGRGGFGFFSPIGLNGVFFNRNIGYSTRAWKVDNISVLTIYN